MEFIVFISKYSAVYKRRMAVHKLKMIAFAIIGISITQIAYSSYSVQAGSFKDPNNAYKYRNQLQKRTRYPVKITHPRQYYVVRVDSIPNLSEKTKVMRLLNLKTHNISPRVESYRPVRTMQYSAPVVIQPTFNNSNHISKMGVLRPLVSDFVPFIAGEASYNWPNIDGYKLNIATLSNISSKVNNNGWGGRFSAGLLRAYNEKFSYTGEIGLGYYGNSTLNPIYKKVSGAQKVLPGRTVSISMDQYGFDVLAGIKLANHYRLHHAFKIAFIVKHLRVLQHVIISLRLHLYKGFK